MPGLESTARQREQQGHDPPTQILDYRAALFSLSPENAEAWQVFNELSPCRPMGMAAGGLPPSEILCWFVLRGRAVDPYLVKALQALDRVFLEYQAKKAAKS